MAQLTTQAIATITSADKTSTIPYTAVYGYNPQASPLSIITGSQTTQQIVAATLVSFEGERPPGLPESINVNSPGTVLMALPSTSAMSTGSASSLTSPFTSAPIPTTQSGSSSSFSITTTCIPTTVNGTSTETCQPTRFAVPFKGRGGVSSGAAAGIAIGCLIAGLLLGIAAAFCFFSRRRQRDGSHGEITEVAMAPSKAASYPQAGSGSKSQDDSGLSELKHFLLDSLSDQELAAELRDRHHLIQQHVGNHYHFNPLDPTRVNRQSLLAALSQLGLGQAGSQDPSAERIISLALDPNTRQIALQHVLSTVILTRIDPSTRSHLSMLPASVASFLQSLPPDEQHGLRRQVDSQAFTLALHWWRVLSAFLLHPQRSQRTALTPSDAALTPQAAGLTQALNRFLLYFVEDSDSARFQQESHLREVIAECAKFGYVLFSQPSDWSFLHVARQEKAAATGRSYHGNIVCAAGLVKHTDKDGRRLGSGILVVPPVVG